MAEDIGTLDAICNGQFTLGIALGYREPEFQAFGVAKVDAVPQLLEVLHVLISSPDDCVEQLHLYHQHLGANHFLLRVQWAGMPQKQVLEAITLVGERIILYLCDV